MYDNAAACAIQIRDGMHMHKNKYWLITAVLCLAFGVAAVFGIVFCRRQMEGIEDTGISTGIKNHSIVYGPAADTFYIGAHDNAVMAFRDGEVLWSAGASGAYSDLCLDEENDRLYAANEDNHVYVYRASDGTLLLDINVQRKVVGIDVNGSRTKIAVITNTGSSKSNLILYSMEGEELCNTIFSISQRGIRYCPDGETLILANKRGEVSRVTEQGEILGTFRTNYAIMQMIRNGGSYWVVCKNGSYFELDESLACLRTGMVSNTVKALISSIGVDAAGEYVLVGTEEGYVFVMDGADRQIYTADIGTYITAFVPVDRSIYLTGYGDFVKNIHADRLAKMDVYRQLDRGFCAAAAVFFLSAAAGMILYLPRLRLAAGRMIKKIWKHRMAYLLLLPTFALLFTFNYRGIFTALIRAFTNWSATNNTVAKMDFVGLDNFKKMLEEGYFLTGMRNLVLLIVTAVLKTITVPLAAAWLVWSIRGDRRKYLHRFLFVLPIVVPGVIGTMIWQKIYDPSIGLINELLERINLGAWQRVWLGDEKTAIWAIIFMGFPFVGAMPFLVYYGGLINIGKDIEESAMIDSATKWDIFWRIQLPLIRPQISIMVTLTLLGTMQDFNGIYILTGGGPGTATYVPALELYLNAAQYGRYGYASALGVVLLIFTMTVTVISNRVTRERE